MARAARPVQVGEVIDYMNAGGAPIKAGDIVEFESFCGVAETGIPVDEYGAVAIGKIWEVTTDEAETFEIGDMVYWDGTKAVRAAGGATPLGVCVAPKEPGVDVIAVKIGLVFSGAMDGGGGGASDARDVAYKGTSHPEWRTVQAAIDGLIDKIEYTKPAITSFVMTPATTEYEIGQSVTQLSFSWAYSKTIQSQSLTDVIEAAANVGTRSGTWTGSLTTNKTFTLTASDGQNSVSASKTISFKHRVYWGSSAKTAGWTSADILGLANKAFADNYRGARTFDSPAGEYACIAVPSAWNMPAKCKISGFETELIEVGTVQFTNASGNTSPFNVFRFSNAGLGQFSAVFE